MLCGTVQGELPWTLVLSWAMCFFNADPASKYHITTGYNLVKVGNKLSVMGKLAKLNNNQYPYMLYDEANTQLLVDRSGKIVTRQGRQVGYLKNHNG